MQQFSFNIASIFGDHMVLQQKKPVRVWGESQAAQAIHVSINGAQVASTQAAPGRWQVTLPPMDACRSLILQITGDRPEETCTFQDVAVGEVWIAGGQSNMEFLLQYDAEASRVIPTASNPDIRFYDCPKIKFAGQENEDDLSRFGFWRPLTPANAPLYSAVGYYFACKLAERLQVPVGIVGCNWGGTTAYAWLDERSIAGDEALSGYLREYEASLTRLDLEAYLAAEKKGRQAKRQFLGWNYPTYLARHTPGPLLYPFFTALQKSSMKNPLPMGPRDQNRPGGLFHTMVEKIAGYTTRGVIWYQGETDDIRASLYGRLFPAVIRCWRSAWQEDLPFLFVQLAPYGRWLAYEAMNFPILREQQELVSKSVPGTYMVSIMDAGVERDVHPKHKRPVGERLALLARGKIYGEDILCEAPEAVSAALEKDGITIAFVHTGSGLYLKGSQLKSLQLFADGREVKGLKVSVTRDTVRIQPDRLQAGRLQAGRLQAVKDLEARLAYQNYAEVNLYNSAGLPVKPFRLPVKTSL